MARMRWIYVAGLIVWLLSKGYEGLPVWCIALIVSFSGFLIWSSFKQAKKKQVPPTDNQGL